MSTATQADLIEKLKQAKRVATPLVAINTPDQPGMCDSIAKELGDVPVVAWDFVRGIYAKNEEGKAVVGAIGSAAEDVQRDPIAALKVMFAVQDGTVLLYYNAHRFVQDAGVCQGLLNLRDHYKAKGCMVVLLGTGITLPAEIAADVVQWSEPLPDEARLLTIVSQQVAFGVESVRERDKAAGDAMQKAIGAEVVRKAAQSLKGTSAFGAEQLSAMSLRRTGLDLDTLNTQARALIEQTPGLHFERGRETFHDIGGLEFAKTFGKRLFDGPKAPTVIVRIEELEKAMAGAKGDLSGTSGDALQVLLSEMEDNNYSGMLAYGCPGCQPASEKVMMADGSWRSVADVRLGDRVLSPQLDGRTIVAVVVATAQYANKPIYRITTKGRLKRSYLASGDHVLPLIGVETLRPKNGTPRRRDLQKYTELTVEQFLQRGEMFKARSRVFTGGPIDVWPDRELPVSPYVVGCFLGDGGWSHGMPAFTTSDRILIESQEKLGAKFGRMYIKPGKRVAKIMRVNYIGETREKLRSLGFAGKKAKHKEIPLEYMACSLNQRLELLAGLIDTDGTADEFSSISPVMAEQFVWLVHSVGGNARLREVNWDDKMGREYRVYRVTYQFCEHVPPTRLEYKRPQKAKLEWKDPRRRSFTVELVGQDTVYGFTLDTPSGLYITNDYLVTHNSGKSLFSKAMANTYGAKGIVFDINSCKGSLVGQSERQIRQAMAVIRTLAGGRAFFVASVNALDTIPAALQRRFRVGTWFFDLPSTAERKQIWALQRKKYGISSDDQSPDEEDLSGADIRNIAEMASTLKCSLAEARRYTVPLKIQSPADIKNARAMANGKFTDAGSGGVYEAEKVAKAGGRKMQVQ